MKLNISLERHFFTIFRGEKGKMLMLMGQENQK